MGQGGAKPPRCTVRKFPKLLVIAVSAMLVPIIDSTAFAMFAGIVMGNLLERTYPTPENERFNRIHNAALRCAQITRESIYKGGMVDVACRARMRESLRLLDFEKENTGTLSPLVWNEGNVQAEIRRYLPRKGDSNGVVESEMK